MSKRSGGLAASLGRRSALRPRHALLLATTALTGSLVIGQALAQSLPTGGSVAAGSAAISAPSSTQLNVTQTSQSAVVNWQSFSIGQGSAVNIRQPNSTAALLNRVTGDAPSSIAGSLTANGQVYLVNPNGIAITATGTVNTGGGFVASTLGISDADFQSGKRSFTGNGASAEVSNAGTIAVGRGGFAALIGGMVSNSGNIFVPLGKVGLGAGERATLDFSGDGFLQVALPSATGGNTPLIRNAGAIKADGGSVIISAATAREAARNAVNISGLVQARSIGGQTGSIFIGGGAGGSVNIAGRLNATSRQGIGGVIAVTGQNIALQGAAIDASGKTGGGTVNIGGGGRGQGLLQQADTVSVDAQSTIRADATSAGNGGAVVLWSTQLTMFAGTISARGGAIAGHGGEAEVSGKAMLGYTGFTDLSAAHGAFGTLLLDPYNVTISNGADTGSFTATGNDSVINATTLQTALGAANVTVSTGSGGSQEGNITVASPLTWSANTTLTLDAYHSVTINAAVTAGGATSGLTILTNHGGSGGLLTVRAPVTMPITGAVTINSTAYTLINSVAGLQAIGANGAYALVGGIDLGATAGFTPLQSAGFTGTFEGFGNTINGLTITNSTNPNVGLFGLIGIGGRVQNLVMTGAAVSQGTASGVTASGSGGVGILAGENDGTIYNVSTAGTVIAASNNQGPGVIPSYGGGLIGLNVRGIIDHSSSSATVSGAKVAAFLGVPAGGLVGGNSGGTISNSYATGAVTGGETTQTGGSIVNIGGAAGGLVGSNGDSTVGGVTYSALIVNSYATGAVTGGVAYKGGFLGDVGGYAGGLVGSNDGTISSSYATGRVTGGYNNSTTGGYAGGLVGYNTNTITNSYATGAVTGGGSVKNGSGGNAGGLVGFNGSVISNSYSTGAVTGGLGGTTRGPSGGLVGGSNASPASVTGNYWDVTTSGKTTDFYTSGVTGLTTIQWLTQGPGVAGSTSGWDFSAVWLQGYPYPVLRALPYIIVTAGAAGTYGGTLGISPGVTATDQTGANAFSLVDISGMTLIGGSTAAAGTLTGLGGAGVRVTAPSGYQIAYAPISATVNPATLTYSVADASGTYGTPATPGAATLTGFVAGDLASSVTGTVGIAAGGNAIALAANTSAGSYIETVNALTGAKAANYVIAGTGNRAGTLTINPLAITVTADAQSRAYGAANPALTYRVTGGNLVGGDVFIGALATAANAASSAGNYWIEQNTLTAGGNYALTYQGANLSVAAAPAPPPPVSPLPASVVPGSLAASTVSNLYNTAIDLHASYICEPEGTISPMVPPAAQSCTGSFYQDRRFGP